MKCEFYVFKNVMVVLSENNSFFHQLGHNMTTNCFSDLFKSFWNPGFKSTPWYHMCTVVLGKNSSNSMLGIAFGNVAEWDIPGHCSPIKLGWVSVTIWEFRTQISNRRVYPLINFQEIFHPSRCYLSLPVY